MPSTLKRQDSETRKLLGTSSSRRTSLIPKEVETAFARYDRAKAKIENFRQENAKIVQQYDRLRSEVTSAFDECKALYAQNKEVLGPGYQGFSITKKRSIDTELLLALLPNAINLVKYTLPVAEFDSMVANGTIPEDVAEQVVTFSEAVSGPKT